MQDTPADTAATGGYKKFKKYKIMTGKEAISAHKFFEVSMETEPEGTDTSFIKKNNWDPEE